MKILSTGTLGSALSAVQDHLPLTDVLSPSSPSPPAPPYSQELLTAPTSVKMVQERSLAAAVKDTVEIILSVAGPPGWRR